MVDDLNPFETAEFRDALEIAFVQAIKKVGIDAFKRISWFSWSAHKTSCRR